MRKFQAQIQAFALRLLARALGSYGPRSLKFGKAHLIFRWRDIDAMLRRDSDFLIGPVNRERIEAVSGPFILGMDCEYRQVRQRAAIYPSLRRADFTLVETTARLAAQEQLAASRGNGEIDIVNGYARVVAARTAIAYFGVAGPSLEEFSDVVRAVFHETFLNLGGDKAVRENGVRGGKALGGWIDQEIASRRGGDHKSDVLSEMLKFEGTGGYSAEDVRWMLSGLIVGAVDTTATAVANIMMEALSRRSLYQGLLGAAGDMDQLRGWCWEALRLRPHNPIVLRAASRDINFAGAKIKSGARVIAVTAAAMQDRRVFPAPAILRHSRPADRYMHFGYGAHHCAGRAINAFQIPMLVGALMREHPEKLLKVSYAGPFPDNIVASLKGGQR